MSVCEDGIIIDSTDFEEKRHLWEKNRLPYTVLFELTPKCNFNCIHCYLQNVHTEAELPYKRIIEILDVLYDKGILFLTLTGGEIFRRSDFKEIYMYAKRKGFIVELFSGGTLIDDSIIEMLSNYPPLLLDISLYGASDSTYEKITKTRNSFSKLMDILEKLKKAGVRIALKCPVLKYSFDEISNMKAIANNLDIKIRFTFDLISTIDKSDKPFSYQIPVSEALRYEFSEYQKNNSIALKKEKKLERSVSSIDKIYRCNVGKGSLLIDYEGKMSPCMKLRHKGVLLTKDNFDEVWEEFSKYADIVSPKNYKCRNCLDQYYCDFCPAEMDFLYNDVTIVDDRYCKIAHARKLFYIDQKTIDEALACL